MRATRESRARRPPPRCPTARPPAFRRVRRAGGTISPDDFADGGAYPEVHQAQYPPGFGPKGATKTGGVQVTMNASGETNYDAIVTAGKDLRAERRIPATASWWRSRRDV